MKDQPSGRRRGYYLVLPNGNRHWFAVTLTTARANIDKACAKHLGNAKSFWVDFSYGLDVFGNPAWSNMDQTDKVML